MTIQSTDRKAGPFLSGTVLPFEFKVFSKEDIAVIYTNAEGVEVVLVLDSDYSVTLNADQDNNPGGTATLTTPIVSGDRANIIGDLAYDQGTDIRNQGGFEPEIIEDALDRATIQIQQLKEISDRTLKTAPGDSRTGDELLADIFEAEENAAVSAAAAEESANRVDLGALDDAVAQTQADVITTTTQAGIATTQAGIATAQAEISTENANATAADVIAAGVARDAAFVNADVYPDTTTGLANTVVTDQFQVVSGDEIVRYRHDAGPVAVEVARYPAVSNLTVSRSIIQPIISEATLLRDLGASSLNNATTAKDVIAITDIELNLFGYGYAQRMDNLAAREETYFQINPPSDERGWGFGDYAAVSVFVKTDDWAGLDASRLRLFTFNRTGGTQSYSFSSFEQIRADLRRYYGVIKLTNVAITDISAMWIEVTTAATKTAPLYATGAMIGLSERFPGGLNWRDAPELILRSESVASVPERGAILKTMVPNGQLIGGGTTGIVQGLSTVAAIVDTELNNLGITHAMGLTNTAATQDCYGRLIADARYYGAGDWLAYSFFVKTADFSGVNTARLRAICLVNAGGGVQTNVGFDPNSYEVFRSDLRRYFGAVRIPTTANITDISQVWIEVTGSTGRSAPIFVTGHAAALSRFRPVGVDWSDFDPFAEASSDARLDVIEAELNLASPQTVPGLLVPSSYHLVQGRALKLYRHGLSEFGRDATFEYVFKGEGAGSLPFVGYVDKEIDLDGNRLSGAGHVYSRPRNASAPIWRRPVTFYSSVASKSGSPRILVIGDSLTQEGTITKLKDKLVGAGVTPSFIGTMTDDGGTVGEGRASWEFSDYTRKHLFIDAANPLSGGTLPTYPIDATGGDGIVTTEAQYLALTSSGNGGYPGRWKYNPFIRPSIGGDDPSFVKNGYIFDFDFYLTRFGFADPDIVMIALGTNDFNSNDNATSAANVAEGLNIMVTQILAAVPSAKIGICFKDRSAEADVAIKAAIDTYGDREAEGLFILPIYSVLDQFAIYDAARNVTVNSTDSYGVQNIAINDTIHPGEVGKEQWAEMTFAFVMNRV